MSETGHFQSWSHYSGLLLSDGDGRFESAIFGFENASSGNSSLEHFEIPAGGAVWAFCGSGRAMIGDKTTSFMLSAFQWAHLKDGCAVSIRDRDTRIMVIQNLGFNGMYSMGGPIEDKGRLRYIDKCTDSLLCPPPLLGDPCLNHLHFPAGIDQSEHTHPSTRAGIVARGRGVCTTPDGQYDLLPGVIFFIPTDGRHKFATSDSSMDVIAFHPDSDFGPTHEHHPMINRTLVGGAKMNNTQGRHLEAEFIIGRR